MILGKPILVPNICLILEKFLLEVCNFMTNLMFKIFYNNPSCSKKIMPQEDFFFNQGQFM